MEEMLEMAGQGAKVIQIRAVEFANKYKVPVRVLSSFESGNGTLISLEENNMENFLKVYELFVKHQDNEIFENIKTKTLVMTGENDIGSTPEMSNNLSKKIANSKVKIISNGKHLCSIECADDVNNAIKEHIKNE